jgi:mannose/fructose/N-acetylgalactosamine-specific phosphotransferase system component IIC
MDKRNLVAASLLATLTSTSSLPATFLRYFAVHLLNFAPSSIPSVRTHGLRVDTNLLRALVTMHVAPS